MRTKCFHIFQVSPYLVLAAISLAGQVPTPDDSGSVHTHGPVVTHALADARLKGGKFNKQGALDRGDASSSIDRFFGAYDRATTDAYVISKQNEQGAKLPIPDGLAEMQSIQVRFDELYSDLPGDTLFPLTNSNIVYAPESTFAGLIVYDSHGKQEARLIGKAKRWEAGASNRPGHVNVGQGNYETVLVNDAHEVASTPAHIVYAKWRDIKGKIAFDGTKEKIAQDHQEEIDALTR